MSTRRQRASDRRRDSAHVRVLEPAQPRGAGQRLPRMLVFVIPAKAGIQSSCDSAEHSLGPRLRGGDGGSVRREDKRDTARSHALGPSQPRDTGLRLPRTLVFVIPAKAGIQSSCDSAEHSLGPRLRGGDGNSGSARCRGRRDRRRDIARGRTLRPSQLRGACEGFPKTRVFVIPAKAGIQCTSDCLEHLLGPRLRGSDGGRKRREDKREPARGRALEPFHPRDTGQRLPKTLVFVIPAKAGIQSSGDSAEHSLGPRLRGGDGGRKRREDKRDTARGRASITRRRAQAPASTGPQRGPHTSRPLRGDTA